MSQQLRSARNSPADTGSRWNAYDAYVDTGIEWLGKIPSYWETRRLRWVGTFSGGGTPSTSANRYWGGEIPWVSPKDMKRFRIEDTEDRVTDVALAETTTSLVPADSVLLVVRSGILRRRLPVAVSQRAVALNQDLKAITPYDGVDSSFLAYWIRAHEAPLLTEWRKEGTTVESLETELIKNTWVSIPPLDEQVIIAGFLDLETRRLGDLIAKKERLIELLEEKRTALITQAVTKGLDPDVAMKDSGVEWLGEIPEHWNTPNLNLLLSEPLSYGVLKPDRYDGEEAVPLIRITDIEDGQIDAEGAVRISPQQHRQYLRTSLEADDVVVSVVGTIGESFVVPPTMRGANLSRALARISLREEVRPQFLHYFIQSDFFVQRCAMIPQGTAQRVLNLGDLGKFPVPLPPLEEQKAIVADLARRLGTLGSAMNALTSAVDTLQEYRSALITAAVTGKIDVRDHAA